jgi:hypothetical protein
MGQSRVREMSRSECKMNPQRPGDPNKTSRGGPLPKVLCGYCRAYQRVQDGAFRDHGFATQCPGSGQPVHEAAQEVR